MSLKTDIQELIQDLWDNDLGDALGVRSDIQEVLQDLWDNELTEEEIAQAVTYHSARVLADSEYDPQTGILIWAPQENLSLEGMWEARKISGLNDGDDISSWSDFSGNNRTMAAGGAPDYYNETVARLINNYPVATFTISDSLTTADHDYSRTTGIYFYAVLRRTNDQSTLGSILNHTGGILGNRAFEFNTRGDGAGKFRFEFTLSEDGLVKAKNIATGYDYDVDTVYLVEVHSDLAADTTSVLVNNIAATLSGDDDAVAAIYNSTRDLGIGFQGLWLFWHFVGEISLILWGTGTLTAAEKTNVRNYIDHWYGVL